MDFPVTVEGFPVTAEGFPVAAEDFPVTAEDFPVAAEDFPVTAEGFPVTAEDFPVTVEKPFRSNLPSKLALIVAAARCLVSEMGMQRLQRIAGRTMMRELAIGSLL